MGAPGTTPGKWSVSKGDSIVKILADDRSIADTSDKAYWQKFDAEDLANANQMAASGALYDALEAMVEFFGDDDAADWECVTRARAALAQARGEVSVHTLEGGL